jgi:hypothetical protein
MKKLLLSLVLIMASATLFAQETPNDIKRYDYKRVERYDDATYSVLVITDCVTNEKDYFLKIAYGENNELYYSDGVVAKILKTFNYLINTKFEPELKGEESFIVCEVSEGFFFRFKPDARHLDLMVRVRLGNNCEEKTVNHLLAGINRNEIEEFESLLLKIEKTFAEKGRNLKDAVIPEDNIEPLF